jgi:hypothetical protein
VGSEDTNTKGLLQANCSDPSQSVIAPKLAYRAVQSLTATFASDTAVHTHINVSVNSTKRYSTRAFVHGNTGLGFAVVWFSDDTPADFVLSNCTSCLQTVVIGIDRPEEALGEGPYQFADLLTGTLYDVPANQIIIQGNEMIISSYPVYDSPVVFGGVQIWS